jgi:hypothetical protein
LLQPASSRRLTEMATLKSFGVIVVFEGFANGPISFAYANRTLAGNQPRTHSGSSS